MLADVLSWAAIMAVPGPDIVAIGMQVSRHGFEAGLSTALGVTLGVAAWSVLSLAGITALLAAVPALSRVLPLLGSAVLMFLGFGALWNAVQPRGDEGRGRVRGAGGSVTESLRLGLVTNLSNPKALVFFSSFFTPMMNHYDSTGRAGAMLALLLAVALLVFSAMTVILRAAATSPPARAPGVRFLPGAIFVAVGVYYGVGALA